MTAQHNKEPILNMPPVVQTLCLLNVGIFLLITFLPGLMTDDVVSSLAFIPARYTDPQLFGADALLSPVTHMFIHANWLHLIVNVATLMAFGSGLEKNMGGPRMLLFYFVTGLCGAGLHFALEPHSPVPMIGASGAISGLFGGIIMMMYGAGMMGSFRKMLPIIAIWIAVSVFFGVFGMPGEPNPIAWDVHIGGFISGMLLYKPFLKLKI
jgi:membrane associated rhomboid family serine protease